MPGLDDPDDEDFPTVGMADYENDEPPAAEHHPDARGSGDHAEAAHVQRREAGGGGIVPTHGTGVPDADNMKFGLPIGSVSRLLVYTTNGSSKGRERSGTTTPHV